MHHACVRTATCDRAPARTATVFEFFVSIERSSATVFAMSRRSPLTSPLPALRLCVGTSRGSGTRISSSHDSRCDSCGRHPSAHFLCAKREWSSVCGHHTRPTAFHGTNCPSPALPDAYARDQTCTCALPARTSLFRTDRSPRSILLSLLSLCTGCRHTWPDAPLGASANDTQHRTWRSIHSTGPKCP